MSAPIDNPFTPDVVAAVMRHMNDDHGDDSVLICRALGDVPGASAAVMSGMDADGIDFLAMVGGVEHAVRVPWSERLIARAQVRVEVTRMYHDACEALGLTPRGGTEH